MKESDLASVTVEAKRIDGAARPWAFVLKRNGVLQMTSGPAFATSFEAVQAGNRALANMKPHRDEAKSKGWT
ncbi:MULTISPECIES: hypothetical protein [unclassified Methylobacterium]|uniref:hypothetical protein n=1 Tax=unclassified Methylobacterium TaxID=2615210 RepID=UPI0011C1DEBB|nr:MULTISPECIES: hypothetical protein [unclassified Methylobacterium]QEE38185.1 hypothetical protein FVA80_03525 [Methylobacterium sp. WL1]TXN55145.1 hypothetical protein FV241_21030 [Methylobacterium sp. WL2]